MRKVNHMLCAGDCRGLTDAGAGCQAASGNTAQGWSSACHFGIFGRLAPAGAGAGSRSTIICTICSVMAMRRSICRYMPIMSPIAGMPSAPAGAALRIWPIMAMPDCISFICISNCRARLIMLTIESTGFIDQTADTYTSAVQKIDAIVAATGNVNKALVLHNLGGGEIAGNSEADATLKVWVNYRVLVA